MVSYFFHVPKSIGKVKFGMTYEQVKKIMNKYKSELIQQKPCLYDYDSGLIFRENNTTIIYANDSNCNKTKKIIEISTCSQDFKTKEGIFSGMKISDLLKIYPNMFIEINRMDEIEYFSPPNYKDMTIELSSDNGGKIGKYFNETDTMTRIFNKSGKINCIKIKNK